MSTKYFGKPVMAVTLLSNDEKFTYKVGDKMEGVEVYSAYGNTTYAGTVIAMSVSKNLKLVGTYNTRIFDSVPTDHSNKYAGNECAAIDNVEDNYVVNNIVLDTGETGHVIIPVNMIVSIGSYTAADGTTTSSLDLGATGASTVSASITAVTAGSTIKVANGTVAEELTVDKSVTLKGTNAGVAQNYSQEVI